MRTSTDSSCWSLKPAFTLTELLVVIAIIAALVAMLLPALNKARRAAMLTQCLSQQHQLYMSMSFYCLDNNQWLPYGRWEEYDLDSSHSLSWDDLLLMGPYGIYPKQLTLAACQWYGVTGTKVPRLKCPCDPDDSYYQQASKIAWHITYGVIEGPSDGAGPFGYGNATGSFGTPKKPPGAKLSSLPPDTFLTTEYPVSNNGVGEGYGLVTCPNNQLQFVQPRNGTGLHGRFLTYSFADGHVEALEPKATIGGGTLTSPKGSWTKARD